MNTHRQAGITLIEVLVAFFVMTVGLLGLAGMQSTSVKDGLDNAKRSQTMWLVTELVERMRANPDGLETGYITSFETSSCSTPTKMCSDSSSGDAETDCTPTEVATYDIWEVFCGNPEANIIANSVDSLNLASISIACDIDFDEDEDGEPDGGTSACTDTSDFTVTMSWDSQAILDSSLLSETDETQSISMTVRP
jgi:type IV pilus assembly protein PilV